MELIGVIIVGVLVALLAAELKSGLAKLSERIIKYHASRLPVGLAERMSEEWLAELSNVGGPVSRLFFALDLFRAVGQMRNESGFSSYRLRWRTSKGAKRLSRAYPAFGQIMDTASRRLPIRKYLAENGDLRNAYDYLQGASLQDMRSPRVKAAMTRVVVSLLKDPEAHDSLRFELLPLLDSFLDEVETAETPQTVPQNALEISRRKSWLKVFSIHPPLKSLRRFRKQYPAFTKLLDVVFRRFPLERFAQNIEFRDSIRLLQNAEIEIDRKAIEMAMGTVFLACMSDPEVEYTLRSEMEELRLRFLCQISTG